MTGEISIRGFVKPVGGVSAKVVAAKQAGAKRVIIPKENWQEIFERMDVEVIGVETVEEVFKHALVRSSDPIRLEVVPAKSELMTAAGVSPSR